MTISFGSAPTPAGGTPNPATNTAPTAGASTGFSFGSGSAAVPNAPIAPPPPNPTAASTTTTAQPPAGGTTFQFGSVPAQPPSATGPSASATPNQSTSPTAEAPGTSAPATNPTPAAAFNFGNSAAAQTTTPASGTQFPSTGTFGLAASGNAAQALSTNVNSLMQIPDFNDAFPNLEIWSTLKRWTSKLSGQTDEARWAGQELLHFLRCETPSDSVGQALAKPQILQLTRPDEARRQNLRAKPVVLLNGNTEAPLSQQIFEDVLSLANDLQVSEVQAIALYWQASDASVRSMIQAENDSLVDKALSYVEDKQTKRPKGFNAITKAARELYFLERSALLKSLRYLLQSRLEGRRIILEASDGIIRNNLVINLVSLIREWTGRILELEIQLSNQRDEQANMSLPISLQLPKKSKQPGFEKVHLVHAQQERQTAVECLFYLSYHTQLECGEIVAIIDLIKDLTNGFNGSGGLARFSPFTDIPSPYEPTAVTTNGFAASFTSPFTPAVSPLKEKDVLSWQREFVSKMWDKGAPHLLNCIAPLVLSAMCAMDARQQLIDRDLHGPNPFGVGNKLLPPGALTTDELNPLHSRLNKEAHRQWNRGDIFGLLAASYALLLRSAPQPLLMSPRANIPSLSIDIRGTSRACLELPTELKSFTFARLTLLPALQRLNNTGSDAPELCDNSEFFLSVLSEFVSHYLDVLVEVGDMPISRQKWEKEEQEELTMRQLQQEQQRQFLALVGTSGESEIIASSIDLLKRPDCMDDVIALATAVCSLGPEYAQHFWSKAETDEGDLMPSRVLAELDRLQGRDESLLPCFLSFLAALACDDKGAAGVHKILSKASDTSDSFSGFSIVNWSTILNTIRWYVQQFTSLDYDSVSSKATTTISAAGTNTAYYYGSDGFASSATSTQSTRESSSSSTSSSSKPKELGERNAIILSSNLAVIMSVASRSSAARCSLLSMRLPIDGGTVDSGDDTLLVLFALARAPLSPELRGATFTTISCLLRTTEATLEEEKKIREMALTGWDCVESCQFLPISLLDQYPQETVVDSGQRQLGMGFPPTSTSLAAGGTSSSVLPADPGYGLVYEMEHIESRMGWYPSTEGFLKLLASLVVAVGCPSKLGERWRLRTGCSPYVEFVVNFVLPRALGTSKLSTLPILPFRVTGDQSRLVAHALSVVDAVLRRYKVPSTLGTRRGSSIADLLGLKSISKIIEFARDDELDFVSDYKNQSISQYVYPQLELSTSGYLGSSSLPTSANTSSTTAGSVPAIPSPKSPGFAILADILSSAGGTMFHVLARILAPEDGKNGGPISSGLESDRAALAYALFGETPPNFSSAKMGAKQQPVPTKSVESLLKPTLPSLDLSVIDATEFDDAVSWREQSIILALRILCATAARDEAFHSAVVSAKEPLKIVPLLRFQKRHLGPSSLQVFDVQLSTLPSLLYSSELATRMRSSFVDYIGYATADTERDIDIATTAIALFYYSYQAKPPHQSVRTLCGFGVESESIIARAMAKRLRASAKRPDSVPDSEVIGLILNWILTELRSGGKSWGSLVEGLLGLPGASSGQRQPTGKGFDQSVPNDCFDAILELLNDEEFVIGSATSYTASLCFEIIFRLYDLEREGDPSSLRAVQYTAEKLRRIDFWRTKVLTLLSDRRINGVSPFQAAILDPRRRDDNVIHSVGWLLKGASCELQLLAGLMGGGRTGQGSKGFSSPHPKKCEHLLSLFFASTDNTINNIIELLPLERNFSDPTAGVPSNEVLQTALVEFPGAREVFGGYVRVNGSKLLENTKKLGQVVEEEAILGWIDDWNTSIAWDCASSHLSNSLHIFLGSSLRSFESLQHYALWNESSSLSQLDPDRMAALNADGVIDILTHLLHRLLGEGFPGRHRGMDGLFIPSATRNLSSAVLLLSQHLADLAVSDATQFGSPNGADIASVCSLLARALAFSGEGGDSSAEAPIMYERTAVLGSALTLMLRSLAVVEPDFVSQQGEDIVHAAATLSNLSCFRVDGEDSVVPILARSILGSLIEICSSEEEAPVREKAFVFRIFAKPVLLELIGLVSSMDSDISTLLLSVALQRFGSDILLSAGILSALQSAAGKYLDEEEKVLKGPSFTYHAKSLDSPQFLSGHLRLLSAILISQFNVGGKTPDIFKPVLDTLSLYSRLMKRIILDFPHEENVLQLYMTCLVQAIPASQLPAFQSRRSDFAWLVSDGGFLRREVYMLCSHLWENPLPGDLLRSLPAALVVPKERMNSNVASLTVAEQPQRSWWDNLGQLLDKNEYQTDIMFPPPRGQGIFIPWGSNSAEKQWSDRMFEYSIVAIDILVLGLSLLKSSSCLDVIDGMSIARGLCNCTDAAWTVEGRLDVVRASYGVIDAMDMGDSRNRELEEQYLILLGDKLKRCVEEILVTCTAYLRELRRTEAVSLASMADFCKTFSSSLDEVGVEPKLKTSFAKHVYKDLQKHLNNNQYS